MKRLIALALLAATAACSRGVALPSPPPLARLSDIALTSDVVSAAAVVTPGATLAALLRAAGVEGDDVQRTVTAASRVFDVRSVRPAHPYRLQRAANGSLQRLEY